MSGRYNSKVFNFFSRQSLRLRDQSAQTWRNVKLAAVWGVQIMLYPIYVGFQATRLVGKQLKQAGQQVLPRLRSASKRIFDPAPIALTTSDTPIQQTLRSIGSLPVSSPQGQPVLLLPAESQPDVERELALYLRQHSLNDSEAATDSAMVGSAETTPDIAAIRIQGVASLLETRGIVLVTTRNQILDVLTLEQQTQLARRIVAETANYWRQQRLFKAPQTDRFLVSNGLPLPKESPHALLPIRLFQKAMAWMQQGSVAVSADLFQESRLALYAPAQPFALTDSSLQSLRSAQPSWVTVEVQFYDWLEQVGRAANKTVVSSVEQGLALLAQWMNGQSTDDRLLQSAQQPEQAAQKLALPMAQPNWISRLDRWLSKVPGLQAAPPALPAQISPPSNLQADLARQIAAQNPVSSIDPSVPESFQLVVTRSLVQPRSTPSIGQSFRNWVQNSLRQILPHRTGLTHTGRATQWELTDTAALEEAIKLQWGKLQSSNSANTEANPSALTAPRRSAAVPAKFSTQERQLETRPISHSTLTPTAEEAVIMPQTWIDTDAQLVGYVKHPLEQLLEWLDRGMLWLEERIAQAWQWFTHPRG